MVLRPSAEKTLYTFISFVCHRHFCLYCVRIFVLTYLKKWNHIVTGWIHREGDMKWKSKLKLIIRGLYFFFGWSNENKLDWLLTFVSIIENMFYIYCISKRGERCCASYLFSKFDSLRHYNFRQCPEYVFLCVS